MRRAAREYGFAYSDLVAALRAGLPPRRPVRAPRGRGGTGTGGTPERGSGAVSPACHTRML